MGDWLQDDRHDAVVAQGSTLDMRREYIENHVVGCGWWSADGSTIELYPKPRALCDENLAIQRRINRIYSEMADQIYCEHFRPSLFRRLVAKLRKFFRLS